MVKLALSKEVPVLYCADESGSKVEEKIIFTTDVGYASWLVIRVFGVAEDRGTEKIRNFRYPQTRVTNSMACIGWVNDKM